MFKFILQEKQNAEKMLARLGEMFNVSKKNQFLRSGQISWQSHLLARELSISHIIGVHSRLKTFLTKLKKNLKAARQLVRRRPAHGRGHVRIQRRLDPGLGGLRGAAAARPGGVAPRGGGGRVAGSGGEAAQ